jgi:hypothetical protein
MGFMNSILDFFKEMLESFFASSSPEYKKKQQLKALNATIRAIEPPIYRPDGYLLPAFPATLNQIAHFLLPVKETLIATIANSDKRVAERTRDYLIELALTPEQRETRQSFTLSERAKNLVAQKIPPERCIEDQGKRFAQFIKALDSSPIQQTCLILEKLEALADLCEFNINEFLAFFDPAFKAHSGQDTSVENPSFHPVEVAEVIPGMLDLYYLLGRVDLSQAIMDIVAILEAKKNGVPLDEDAINRNRKIAQAVAWLLKQRLGKDQLIAIIRITKGDPDFNPEQPKLRVNYLQEYKDRLTEVFHSDSRKLLQERQSQEINGLITNTFGSTPLEKLQGYSESTNTLIQEFTTFSLEWIQPLEIIKTFSRHYFDPHFKQIIRSVIVEGYFVNRTQQTTLATAYYYCESVPSKLSEFESLFGNNQPCSIKILTGYLTEMEKGMDFEKPLRKMIENMNACAKTLVQQAVTQYAEVFNFAALILDDNKRTVPEYITNIRTLTMSTKNSESFSHLEKEIGVFHNFLEIMKKYAIVGTLSVSTGMTERPEN